MQPPNIEILFYQQSASGEYRGVDLGLNNKVALKFSPFGVVLIYIDIYAINFSLSQENDTLLLARIFKYQ